jgi:hypothetical protein
VYSVVSQYMVYNCVYYCDTVSIIVSIIVIHDIRHLPVPLSLQLREEANAAVVPRWV